MADALEEFVQQQQSGTYQSYDALVQAGLKLLQEHEEVLDRVADALRPACRTLSAATGGEDVDCDDLKVAVRDRLAHGRVPLRCG